VVQELLHVRITGSAIAEGPRDALIQLKYCQLLHNCAKKSYFKRPALGPWPWRSLKDI